MEHNCSNCIFKKEQHWNMVRPIFYSCKKGKSYTKDMFKKNMKCDLFGPTFVYSQQEYLKEIYRHEMSMLGEITEKNLHYWTIVKEGTEKKQRYKRISGSPNLWLKFKTEKDLDYFYLKYNHKRC